MSTRTAGLVSSDGKHHIGLLHLASRAPMLTYNFQTISYQGTFSVPLQPFTP